MPPGSSSIESHLACAARLRLCVARTLASTRLALILSGDDDVAENLDEQTRTMARSEISSPSGRTIDRFFADVEQSLPAVLRAVLARPSRASINTTLSALADELRNELTHGSDDIFGVHIDAAQITANSYYQSSTGDSTTGPPVTLEPWTQDVHVLRCDEQVAAKVPPDSPSRVELRFNALEVTDDVVCAVPYVLLHELICHAYAGIPSRGSRTCEAHSPFSEGLMDYVAGRILAETLEGRGVAGGVAQMLPDTFRCLAVGAAYQSARYESGTAFGRREVAARKFGWETGGALERCFLPHLGSTAFFSWTVCVNASDLPHDDRDTLVVAIGRVLTQIRGLPNEGARTTERVRLVEVLGGLSDPAAVAAFGGRYLDEKWL